MIFNPVLSEIFSTKKTKDLDGRERITDDMIGEEEAGAIYKMFKKSNAKTTIEVGLAHGVSALVFCQAHAECGNQINSSDKTLHFAIDPNQFTTYSGAAVAVISKAGYSDFFNT
jgi:predicted O-methyltransferase YrrM